MRIEDFRDLRVWQSGHALVLFTYQITKTFPQDEVYALSSQMRRAVTSITSNLAEGFGRSSSKDREHFYVMAQGSLFELDNQLQIAHDLSYISTDAWEQAQYHIKETRQLLSAFLRVHRQNSKL